MRSCKHQRAFTDVTRTVWYFTHGIACRLMGFRTVLQGMCLAALLQLHWSCLGLMTGLAQCSVLLHVNISMQPSKCHMLSRPCRRRAQQQVPDGRWLQSS